MHPETGADAILVSTMTFFIRCAVENDRKHDDLCVGDHEVLDLIANKELGNTAAYIE